MAVMPDYPEIRPEVVPAGLVKNTREVTIVFLLFIARVHDINRLKMFLPGYDWRNPTILPYIRAISSDLSPLVPLMGVHKDELRWIRGRPKFFFCARCGKAIEDQQGCRECGTEGVFLFGVRPETIPHLEMVIPQKVLEIVRSCGSVFWWGKGRVIGKNKAEEIIDRLTYHPPPPPKDYFIGAGRK